MMQITKDKCVDVPGGDCSVDSYFNVRTGSKYSADTVNSNGGESGDLLKSVGSYNGWQVDITFVRIIYHHLYINCYL